MAKPTNATPLLGLDAIVIDTETTGLAAAKARVVEIAAVRVHAGQVDDRPVFHSLVRPDVPIPATATRIHGIDAAKVGDAPSFASIWPDLQAAVGDHVVIGHTVGFDLAVLKGECERAGLSWTMPRPLDTRLLAEVAAPDLAGYSIDQLCAYLGLDPEGRHSALADAVITARLFLALVPRLREKGIRTLAEAEQACRALTEVLAEQHRAGWVEAVTRPIRAPVERELGRIDSYPYRHRVADVMSRPATFVAPDLPLADVLKQMASARISSVFVHAAPAADRAPRAEETGIVTERDVLRALAERGAAALSEPVERSTSRPLSTVAAEAFVYRAIARMNRLKVRHLGVTGDGGAIVGALSSRDLLRLRAEEAVALGDEIDLSGDVPELARAWAKLPLVAARLLAEDVPGIDIAAVISRELAALTRQAAVLAERRMARDGHGAPPCAYALAVLGSAGRGESLLAMDQDNALVFASGAPGGPEDVWFGLLGSHVADILHAVGVPYCKGGVMAKNPQWRGSLDHWRERVAGWIRRSRPEDLLSVDIFFDLRGVHGDVALADTLWRESFALARGETGFAKSLAEAAGTVEQGLSFFGGFRTDGGRIDVKKAGLFGIVTLARVLAIRHHLVERATPARIAALKALGLGAERDLDALIEAQRTFLDLMLEQQIDDIEHGLPATNTVLVKRLTRREREHLRAALGSVAHLDDLIRDLLFRD